MKKSFRKYGKALLVLAAVLLANSCSNTGEESHTHIFDTEYSSNELYHWHAAICGHKDEVKGKENHEFPDLWVLAKDNSAEEERFCKKCDYRQTKNHEHVEGDWIVLTEPSCVNSGLKSISCQLCGITFKTENFDTVLGYNVTLDSFDATKKIGVIKVVKEQLGIGLGAAKTLVESAPSVLKIGVSLTEAEYLKQKVIEAGGSCSVSSIESNNGHIEDSGTITQESTSTSTGIKTYKCIFCSQVLRTETVPVLQ